MKWGFNWECGVFELWAAVGVGATAERWRNETRPIPPLVEKLLASGKKRFYEESDGTRRVFDFAKGEYRVLEDQHGIILLPSLKARKREIKKNPGASLVDLGDGVAGLEF